MPLLISMLIAFVVGYLLLAWLLRRVDRLPLDHPNERSLHDRPLPRVGGLGLVAGVCVALAWWRPTGLDWLLAMTVFLVVVSWLDDVRGLSVWVRLPAHVLAAGVFLVMSSDSALLMGLLGLLAIVWMTNLYNFMDGADGFAGGMAVTGFGAYGLAAWLVGDMAVLVLSWSIVAAALAFLCFNFPPARLFLGDGGSIPLGFLAAGLGWLGVREGMWPPLFPLLVFSPFIVDASVTLLTRLLRGERIWLAHRSHYYQRLIRMGMARRRLLLLEYALMLGAALSGLMLVLRPNWAWGLGMAWLLIYVLLMMAIDQRWRKHGHAH
jgi:UDP-GlcNAc:undecaprenyl-phosphate/decaprenyl-phosphate GlcNAc-1-phosphate transferase